MCDEANIKQIIVRVAARIEHAQLVAQSNGFITHIERINRGNSLNKVLYLPSRMTSFKNEHFVSPV